MYLVKLIYASSATDQFAKSDIENILSVARAKNSAAHITGMLCFNHSYFLQCIEGGRKEVNALYQTICKDSRHRDIIILDYQPIIQRSYHHWSMGYVPDAADTKIINFSYFNDGLFNPYRLSSKGADSLLQAYSALI